MTRETLYLVRNVIREALYMKQLIFNFRTEEKKQLGQLNDRLAAYIDRVRSLEIENGRLEKKVRYNVFE